MGLAKTNYLTSKLHTEEFLEVPTQSRGLRREGVSGAVNQASRLARPGRNVFWQIQTRRGWRCVHKRVDAATKVSSEKTVGLLTSVMRRPVGG